MHGTGAPNCRILGKISFFPLIFRIMDVAGAERLAGAKRANAGTKTEKTNMAAVASPQGQQPPADEHQKSKAVEEKSPNRSQSKTLSLFHS